MRLVEIRELDGPNVFMLEPAIKIELAVAASDPSGSIDALISDIVDLHHRAGVEQPRFARVEVDDPGHVAVAFSWNHRRLATAIAEEAVASALGSPRTVDVSLDDTLRALAASSAPDDAPEMITNAERTAQAISVTGTNGKTTTTRLIAHIIAATGQRVGWSCSSGVYIDGEEVLEGDYSGPSGARRILLDPSVQTAVLETARGGILLRGMAYESNDVSVFTNVSADHLGLQGVLTVETMASVKAVVVAITKPDGFAVLNANVPLVLRATAHARARRFLVSARPDNEEVLAHIAAGGRALVVDDGAFVLWSGEDRRVLLPVSDAPMTLGGRADHMVENALCGTAACLAAGLPVDVVVEGLRSFSNSPEHNPGRMNTYELGGVRVIVDYAHNEDGLRALLESIHKLYPGRRVTTVIGTAGDRTDESLRAVGEVAARLSDVVIIKETRRYLRGRTNAEMDALYLEGARSGGNGDVAVLSDELSALRHALSLAHDGDVVAMMCQEQGPEVVAWLTQSISQRG